MNLDKILEDLLGYWPEMDKTQNDDTVKLAQAKAAIIQWAALEYKNNNQGDTIMENQELTFGGKAVGLSFNPSGNAEVNALKVSAANFIDEICGPSGEKLDFKADAEAAAMRKLAQRAAQEAQMWAVKAATWQS